MKLKNFLSVVIFILLTSGIAVAVDLKFITGITQTPDPATAGSTVMFTVSFKNFDGAVDNLKIIGGVDGTGIFERTYAHINTDSVRTDTFTWTVAAGAHTVWFELDPNHNQGDSDYSNNRIGEMIRISSTGNYNISVPQSAIDNMIAGEIPVKRKPVPVIAKPNLKIIVTYNADGLTCGGMINFNVKVINSGDKAAAGFVVKMYYRDNIIASINFSPIESGDNMIRETGDVSLLCEPNCTSLWKFVVDPENVISESNEEDNLWQTNLTLECADSK